MVFNATFNNISVISWRSVLLVEDTGVPRENLQNIILLFLRGSKLDIQNMMRIASVVNG
jgi:hypothetical protein